MRFSLDWLREFVDVDLEPAELAARLSLGGFAVDAVEQLVPPSDPVGPPDTVLDIDVPSNRPDAMNHLGMAREVAALTGKPLRAPAVSLTESASATSSSAASIAIEAADLCPRYVGRVVRGVRTVESPRWMKRRLEAIGVAPKNVVVDASNYVLFELGQPLHAFDLARLSGRGVVVRRARPGERLVTVVDHAEKTLAADMLVIAQPGGAGAPGPPAAIAGVMGGLETAISDATTEVLIESAWFDPLSVRRTARALDLKTDASHRFERGADPAMTRFAADRLAALLVEHAGGEALAGAIDARGQAGPASAAGRPYVPIFEPPVPDSKPAAPGTRGAAVTIELPVELRAPIPLRRDRIGALLGIEIGAGDVAPTLARVGVQVFEADARPPFPSPERATVEGKPRVSTLVSGTPSRDRADDRERAASPARAWGASPPSWRWDLAREEDLIEEIARLVGYERIPETLPEGAGPVPTAADAEIEDRARDLLVTFGYGEAISYAMISSADDEVLGPYDALARDASGHPERPDGESARAALQPAPPASRLRPFDDHARIRITNPLSDRWEVMRRSLLPGLARTLAFNVARGRHDARLFEVGSVHRRADGGDPIELRAAAVAACGFADEPSWPTSARPYDVLDLKGAIEALAAGLGGELSGASDPSPHGSDAGAKSVECGLRLVFEPPLGGGSERGPFHPGQSFLVRLGDLIIGRGGRLHPDLEAALEIERPLYGGEILLDPFIGRLRTPRYRTLPRLNPVERDLSFFVDATLPYSSVAAAVAAAIDELVSREEPGVRGGASFVPTFFLLDRFEGKSVPPGKVSYALRFRFSPRERSLTAEELNGAIERVAQRLASELAAEIRSR